ncbi:MAG: HIT family protein [Sulfurifustaceae bacterium]
MSTNRTRGASAETGDCPLCAPANEEAILWRDAACRVVEADEPDYPGYCRVIWNAHVREMSDLATDERTRLIAVVCAVEESLRAVLRPAKINLASLGNQVPHLHWHVIPRFEDDCNFPDSIWAPRRRPGAKRKFDRDALQRELSRRLASLEPRK